MNKVFNINLGGYPFTIDEDAFEHLNRYLDAIKKHFRSTEGRDEILNDIETRMAELLQERISNRSIASLKDIKEVIAIMGTPEEFGAEPMSEGGNTADHLNYKTGKKLFRNPEDETIGGVCSGVAAYFGIQDPVWVRLFFVLFTLSGGFGIPLYIILWIILPKAETASDRLSMRGEPINFSTIGKIIQEEFQKFSQGMTKFGEELSNKATGENEDTEPGAEKKKSSSTTSFDFGDALSRGFSFVGQIANAVFSTLHKIWKPILIAIGVLVALSFIGAWTGLIAGMYVMKPFFEYLFPGQTTNTILAFLNLLFVVAIPLATIILGISRLIFGTYVSMYWRVGLGVFWWINLTSLAIIGGRSAQSFQASAQVDQAVQPLQITGDTLRLTLAESPRSQAEIDFDGGLVLLSDGLAIDGVRLDIAKAEGTEFGYSQSIFTRGSNRPDAEKYAGFLKTTCTPDTNNKLLISPYFIIPKGNVWRGQNVEMTLHIPVGKIIVMDEGVDGMLDDVEKAEGAPSIWENLNRTWQMGPEGLTCLDCPQQQEQ